MLLLCSRKSIYLEDVGGFQVCLSFTTHLVSTDVTEVTDDLPTNFYRTPTDIASSLPLTPDRCDSDLQSFFYQSSSLCAFAIRNLSCASPARDFCIGGSNLFEYSTFAKFLLICELQSMCLEQIVEAKVSTRFGEAILLSS